MSNRQATGGPDAREVPGESAAVQLVVNGVGLTREIEVRLTLADFLRERLGLTGTHLGCEHGVCGACTVLVAAPGDPADPMRSCLMLAVQADGLEVTTVEGLTPRDGLSVLQASFRKHHALQCGFCTPGLLATATALLAANADPTPDQVRDAISGSLCRCTGYIPIVDAILDAAATIRHSSERVHR